MILYKRLLTTRQSSSSALHRAGADSVDVDDIVRDLAAFKHHDDTRRGLAGGSVTGRTSVTGVDQRLARGINLGRVVETSVDESGVDDDQRHHTARNRSLSCSCLIDKYH